MARRNRDHLKSKLVQLFFSEARCPVQRAPAVKSSVTDAYSINATAMPQFKHVPCASYESSHPTQPSPPIQPYDRFTGPLTPAPITLGNSSFPMPQTSPTANPIKNTMATLNSARIQNWKEMSFF
jgi:hypothetical protein